MSGRLGLLGDAFLEVALRRAREGIGLPAGELDALLDRLGLAPAPGPPNQVHLSVTDRCFLPCLHCDIHRKPAMDLPTDTWLRFLDRLSAWVGQCGVNLAGGEPLVRTDLEQIISRAAGLGFTVSFNTNGWLVTRRRARAIAEAGAAMVYVSLDGTEAALVDWTRGREGAFARASAALDHLTDAGVPQVVVAMVLHGQNARQVPDMLRLVREKGLQLVIQPLFQNFGDAPYDAGWFQRSPLWPADPGAVLDALDLLAEERRAGGPVCNCHGQLVAMKSYFKAPDGYNGLPCRAGYTDLAVDARGNIRLCFFLDPIGHLDDPRPLEVTWASLESLRRRWQVSRCERACNLLNCNFEASGG